MYNSNKRVKLENEQKHTSASWKRQCASLLETIFHWDYSAPFHYPVNLNEYPDYRNIIDSPMDLSTVREKLGTNLYSSPVDFCKDMRLIFQNSRNYNTNKQSRIYLITIMLSAIFEEHIRSIVNDWRSAVRLEEQIRNRPAPIPVQQTDVHIDCSIPRSSSLAACTPPSTSRESMQTIKPECSSNMKAYTHVETKQVNSSNSKISWQNNCSTITRAFKHMLDHEIAVDAVFKKNKTSCLFAHKIVLSIWSPKFADWIAEIDKKQMFSITFEEDVDVMQIILQYLYSPDDDNCFSRLSRIKLFQALEISERFEIHHVYKECLNVLHRRKICASNVSDYFDYGLKKNFHSIVRKCVRVLENEVIHIKSIKTDFSIKTLLHLLTVDKINMNSEADLLHLAVSWLYSHNTSYRNKVLSFIDLQSISQLEYQDICMKYPNFFSDAELSSIILSQLRQDPKLLPSWYKPQIKTVVDNSCSVCIHIHKKIKIMKPLQFFKNFNHKDLKSTTQKFEFKFRQFMPVKLLNVELNFGPIEISLKEFTLKISVNMNTHVKEYSISAMERNGNYKIFFSFPLVLKLKDTLILKFDFHRGLFANNIHVFSRSGEQPLKLDGTTDENDYSVCLSSSEVAFYLSSDFPEKFIVSSFYLNACKKHRTFLCRKRLESLGTLNVDHNFENDSESVLNDVDVTKDDMKDVKMEVDDDDQDCQNKETPTVLNTSIMKEEIMLDASDATRYSSFQIMECDRVANIKQEIIDITDE